MQIQEILSALTFNRGDFPRHALQEAVARREEIMPELLRILRETKENIDQIAEQEDYMAHIYAMFLLAQFREPRAYPLLVDLFSLPDEAVRDAMGFLVTEDLQRLLASVCGGDTGPIKELAENVQVDEYVRSAALYALLVLVVEEEIPREEAMSYYRHLLRGGLERKFSHVWNGLVGCCTNLYPEEVMADIEQAFADGLVEEDFIDMEFVQEALDRGKERVLQELRRDRHNHYVHDVIREMEWWYCFQPEPPQPGWKPAPRLPESPRAPVLPAQPAVQGRQLPIRAEKKVGRNDPCPCGSGKKYKKCCGAARS